MNAIILHPGRDWIKEARTTPSRRIPKFEIGGTVSWGPETNSRSGKILSFAVCLGPMAYVWTCGGTAFVPIEKVRPERDPYIDRLQDRLLTHLIEAERKAWDSLARYKFQMFGYWAAIWVHLNRVGKFKRQNPFRGLVKIARLR